MVRLAEVVLLERPERGLEGLEQSGFARLWAGAELAFDCDSEACVADSKSNDFVLVDRVMDRDEDVAPAHELVVAQRGQVLVRFGIDTAGDAVFDGHLGGRATAAPPRQCLVLAGAVPRNGVNVAPLGQQ